MIKLNIPSYGVFPADRIPQFLGRPAGIIVNTDDHRHSGQHWQALFITRTGTGIFFDSFGRKPNLPYVKDRLRKNTTSHVWNTKRLQSLNSTVCGQYCIMFLYYMKRGYSLSKFCQMFSSTDYHKNDFIAFNFHKNIKKISNKKVYKNNVENYIGKGNIKKPVWVQSCIPRIM